MVKFANKNQETVTNKLVSIAEDLGFSVDVYENNDGEGGIGVTLSKYSPCGQDFSFDIDVDADDTTEDVRQKVVDYYYAYDPDYEAYLWIDPATGHGKNGAPYNIRDIIDDMEACEDYIGELSLSGKWNEE